MFIIVPLIIIFLLFSYLQLSEVSFFGEIVIYLLMFLVGLGSYIIFKKVKDDYKIQQQNTINLQIQELEKKLKSAQDVASKKAYLHKIEVLKKDLQEF